MHNTYHYTYFLLSFVSGIQQYLLENNRIDNIFTDSYYEKFTDCLNEIAQKFSVIFNDSSKLILLLTLN